MFMLNSIPRPLKAQQAEAAGVALDALRICFIGLTVASLAGVRYIFTHLRRCRSAGLLSSSAKAVPASGELATGAIVSLLHPALLSWPIFPT